MPDDVGMIIARNVLQGNAQRRLPGSIDGIDRPRGQERAPVKIIAFSVNSKPHNWISKQKWLSLPQEPRGWRQLSLLLPCLGLFQID
jgi:hypothetical protein